jgi:short-subunit dehydrogenase
LTELAAEIERDHGVRAHAVQCDVTSDESRRLLLADIADRGEQVDILINNAGAGPDGPFWEDPLEVQIGTIELNAVALTALTHMVLPEMIERGSGAILNVASTAAMQPIPRQAVYAATKSYVLSFSQALNQELKGSGVNVTVLCPGPTRTEFFGDRQEDLEKDSPGFVWQNAHDCAKAGLDGLFKRKRVVVPKAINRIGAVSARHSPTGVTLEMLDRFWPMGK